MTDPELLRTVVKLLYPGVTLPHPATLGRLRHALRTLADDLDELGADEGTGPGEES